MSKARILVVEDEEDICDVLRCNLATDGYEVTVAANGEEALKKVAAKIPDLVVLDIMLPGINGLEVCRALKKDSKTSKIAVVMLSARGEESDIVVGLELGADDYVTKPFSVKVLMARVRAALRRHQEPAPDNTADVRRHDLVIRPGRHEVLLDGKPLDLTVSELRILHFLAVRAGWVMTRQQIVDAVHGTDYAVTERCVDVQIVGLRKKLGAQADYIETVRGVGYRFRE